MIDGTLELETERLARISSKLYTELRRAGADPELAADAVQEAWVRTLARRRHLPRRLEPWMRTVARRALMELFRKRRNRDGHERAAAVADRIEAETPSDSPLMSAVRALPEHYREVLELHYLRGLETPEIADHLGRSVGTVRSQLKRGRDRLRDSFAPRRRFELGALFLPLDWVRRLRDSLNSGPLRSTAAVGCSLVLLCAVSVLVLGGERRTGGHADVRTASLAATGGPLTAAVPSARAELVPAPAVPEAPGEAAARALDGVVLDADGAPAAGARIHRGSSDGLRSEVLAVADSEGRFAIDGLRRDDFVWATLPGALPSDRVHAASRRAGTEVEVVLGRPDGILRARLVDESGLPLARARAVLSWDDDLILPVRIGAEMTVSTPVRRQTELADADGWVALAKPAGERATLAVTPEGGASSFLDVRLAAGSETRLVVVPAPLAVEGLVVDELGRPVADARIEAFQDGRRMRLSGASDGRGEFRIEGLRPGACELRAVSGRDPGDGAVARVRIAGRGAFAELVLSGADSVRGTVTRDGAPVAGARVALLGEERTSALTRADGTFDLVALDDAENTLVVFEGDGDWPSAVRSAVRPGAAPLRVRLKDGPRLLARTLDFRRGPGTPLPTMVEVRVRSQGVSVIHDVDPRTGRAEILVPAGAETLLFAWFPELGTWSIRQALDWSTAVVPVRVPRPIEVDVALAGGLPDDVQVVLSEPGFGSRLWDSGRVQRQRLFRARGSEHGIRAMPSGVGRSVAFHVLGEGYSGVEHGFGLRPGAQAALELLPDGGVPVQVEVPVDEGQLPSFFVRLADGRLVACEAPVGRRADGVATFELRVPPDAIEILPRIGKSGGSQPIDVAVLAAAPTTIRVPVDRPWLAAGELR